MVDTDVLIAGAGPIGLTAAIELARRGIDFRIVDPLTDPPQYAKAVGVQPRTLEVFEGMGVLRRILDAAIQMFGQTVYVNGEKVGQIEFATPADVPFGFVAIPQYATERILREELAMHGVQVERGLRLSGFEQDADGVTATLDGDAGSRRCGRAISSAPTARTARCARAWGCRSRAARSRSSTCSATSRWIGRCRGAGRSGPCTRPTATTDDLLVCIPLPGRGRYRMSMLVPDDLAAGPSATDGVAHGFEGARKPELHHIQAVLDRLSPEPTTARNMRWSSVFRISHRIVDATATAGSSSRATPRTSIPRPARRA